MIDLIEKFDSLWVHRDAVDSEVGQRLLQLFGNKAQVIDGEPPNLVRGSLTGEQFTQSKKQIFVTPFRGSFFKKCPGFHKGLACCNYFVLNLGFQCDMDCSYCYLQSFINSNYLTIYSNIEDALAELEAMEHLQNQPVRVGTGEVIDSLSLDPLTLYSKKLIAFFKNHPKWRLEFKTKSAAVDQFIHDEHSGNIIVSWSINPQNIIASEEHQTASMDQRLEAAVRCRDKGFSISFHIDPMIWHPLWKENYAALVDAICARFKPQDIPYLSVGALRYQPEQKNMMRERFTPASLVNQAETFPGADGKLRYDQALRTEMFQWVVERFRNNNPQWKIFMCMETPETWIQTYGGSPHRQPELKELFQTI